MATSHSDSFEQPWPAFLELLESSPRNARDRFSAEALRLLKVCPPGKIRGLPESYHDDAIQRIIHHCIDDNCRVLKMYRTGYGNFAAWFTLVARNEIAQIIRKLQSERRMIDPAVEPPEVTDNPGPELWNEAKRITFKCLAIIEEECRILLLCCSDESKPAEIAAALGRPKADAKKLSGRIQRCREKLQELMKEHGYDSALLFRNN